MKTFLLIISGLLVVNSLFSQNQPPLEQKVIPVYDEYGLHAISITRYDADSLRIEYLYSPDTTEVYEYTSYKGSKKHGWCYKKNNTYGITYHKDKYVDGILNGPDSTWDWKKRLVYVKYCVGDSCSTTSFDTLGRVKYKGFTKEWIATHLQTAFDTNGNIISTIDYDNEIAANYTNGVKVEEWEYYFSPNLPNGYYKKWNKKNELIESGTYTADTTDIVNSKVQKTGIWYRKEKKKFYQIIYENDTIIERRRINIKSIPEE